MISEIDFSLLFCAACLGKRSFQRLFSVLSISSTFGRKTTLRAPGDAGHGLSFLDARKTVSFLIWKENKKPGQGSRMHQHLLNFHHIVTEHLNDYKHIWEYTRRLNSRSKLGLHMWHYLGIQLHHTGKSFLMRKGCCRFRHRQAKMINLFPFATAQITVLSLQHWVPSRTSIKAAWLMVRLSVRPNVYENEQSHCQRNVEHWVLSRGLLSQHSSSWKPGWPT